MKILKPILAALALVFWLVILIAFFGASQQAFGQVYALTPVPRFQFLTNNGTNASGHKLCFLAAGTTTPQSAYATSSGTALPNPVTLNSAGRPQTGAGAETAIYLDDFKNY